MKGFKSATECLHCVADFAIQGGIDMEETKNLCIYTGKDETQAHFKNQEHIIPACIGGMQRLPKGYVSDEINILFSGLELKLARNSPITLPRMFVGPGKRGSRNPKRRGGASKMVSVMQSNETGKYSLGYIRMGVPITIDQIQIVRMENGKHRVSLCFDSEDTDEKNFFEKSAEWMQKLQEFDGQATLMLTDGFPENEVILGHESGRWYLAAATGTEAESLKVDLIEELKQLGKAYMKELLNQSETETQETKPSGMEGLGKLCKEKSQITSNMRQEIDLFAYYRVVAKIAFNCLAKVRGREYVMQQKFDPIREAILMDASIGGVPLSEMATLQYTDSRQTVMKQDGKYTTTITASCVSEDTDAVDAALDKLVAEVMLYGSSSPMLVILSSEDCRDFGEMDGYVCDWENQREMRFLDYLGEITHVDREPYEWE